MLRICILQLRDEDSDINDEAAAELIMEIATYAEKQVTMEVDTGHRLARIANTLRRNNRYEEALSRYREAIELRPEDWKLRVDLAEALGMNQKYDEAIQIVEGNGRLMKKVLSLSSVLPLQHSEFRGLGRFSKQHP